MGKWLKRRSKHKEKAIEPINPEKFIGQEIYVTDLASPVKIEHVYGNRAHETHFEINGKYLVTMLSFYMQMLDGRLPSREEEEEWLQHYTPTKPTAVGGPDETNH